LARSTSSEGHEEPLDPSVIAYCHDRILIRRDDSPPGSGEFRGDVPQQSLGAIKIYFHDTQ
jgi:hypothetical protein